MCIMLNPPCQFIIYKMFNSLYKRAYRCTTRELIAALCRAGDTKRARLAFDPVHRRGLCLDLAMHITLLMVIVR